ncbi:MAG TPA: pyruvate kinase, partial [Caldilineaceae bacterium]|nr:pyruvate kinase [Caldilineaceae bacterium]
MQAKTTVHDLYKTMVALRQDILSESENLLGEDRSQIVRDEYLASARNLACYLSLRRRDLRDLQAVLMQYGLSSLGRSESRVIPTLDAVITTLAALDQLEGLKGPGYALDQFFYGANQLTHQADAILGRGQHGRSTRIMVTLPTEAAEDQSLIQALVKQGVECVRINCAHDDPLVWGALIANVRQAEQDDQRAEPVRVLMDLAGPK